MSTTDVEQIFRRVDEALATAECGLRMVLSADDPSLRLVGLRNLVVFGRAVTNVLQQLRSVLPAFDGWYALHVQAMRSDSIMMYFYKLRSEILKEGRLSTAIGAKINVDIDALLKAVPQPPGATGFFIGDPMGGSGWTVVSSDGTTQKFYVQIPDGIPGVKITVNLHLAEAPQELRAVPVTDLARHYFGKLDEMCSDAHARFALS